MGKQKKRKKRKKASRKYYQSPSPEDSLRYKLVNGAPLHRLLHYQHKKSVLPEDIADMCRAGEILHEVDELLGKLMDLDLPHSLGRWAEVCASIDAFRSVVRSSAIPLRQALVERLIRSKGGDE